jgi:ubiquitin-like protein Pup
MAKFLTARRLKRSSSAEQERDEWAESLPFYMAAGEQKTKQKGGGGDDADGGKGEGGQKLAEKGEELKEEMDNLLDEIDSVLEENAEEFVKNYVQRGGE